MNKLNLKFLYLPHFEAAVLCLCLILLTSFNSSKIKIEIPGDLDKETIIFSKAPIIRAFTMHGDYYTVDKKGDIVIDKGWEDIVQKHYDKCLKTLEDYPFKFITLNVNCRPVKIRNVYDIEYTYVAMPESVKYEFITIRDEYDPRNYNLHIRELSTGKLFQIQKHSYPPANVHQSIKKVISAIKKKYGK